MSDKKGSTFHLSGLFREEAETLLGFSDNDELATPLSLEAVAAPDEQMLSLFREKQAPEKESQAYWRKLRAFFRTGEGLEDDVLEAIPALLAPDWGRQSSLLPYPIWMDDNPSANPSLSDGSLRPMPQVLADAVESFAPDATQAGILKENMPRLLHIALQKLHGISEPFKAYPVLEESLNILAGELDIHGPEGEAFLQDVNQLKKALPKSGLLAPFSAHTTLHLLANYLKAHLSPQRRKLRAEIQPLLAQLRGLLEIEQEKRPDSRSSEHLQSGMGFAEAFLNFDELSAVLPESGAALMPEARLQRIQQAVETLEQADAVLFDTDAILLAGKGLSDSLGFDWAAHFPGATVHQAEKGQCCNTAMALFSRHMKDAAQIFGALRLAKLEVENAYASDIHDAFFAHFDWRQFSDEEMAACPPVLLVADATELMEGELAEYSAMLASAMPARVVLLRQRGAAEAAASGSTSPSRPEPGALAIAHRNVYFFQGPALQPGHLFNGLQQAFSALTPAIMHIMLDGAADGGHIWMSAAVEGREFPGFTYDSRKGPKWGSRFDIGENPQLEYDWPIHNLVYTEDGAESQMSLPFTFADFAAQHPAYAAYYRLVPEPYWADNLVPLGEYLALPLSEGYSKVPFIWVADSQQRLRKAAVAWPVVLASGERLDFWRYLQENAGVHSFHVELATEKLRLQAEAEAEAQIKALKEAHRQEIEQVREETARQAMEQLADVLLGLEPLAGLEAALAPTVTPSRKGNEKPEPVAASPEAPEVNEVAIPPKQEEEPEALMLGDAWIDTPQCTSCNECTSINNRIFKYNADGQAFVADPKGGPFADIVRAAESCPARIIHPGAPQDPKEPGVDALVKKAEPFN
ncbi:MAG: ferredoxin [Lewinellaceae bacterium]|nr:ferredoxin [Lewinellaceae bacterium]